MIAIGRSLSLLIVGSTLFLNCNMLSCYQCIERCGPRHAYWSWICWLRWSCIQALAFVCPRWVWQSLFNFRPSPCSAIVWAARMFYCLWNRRNITSKDRSISPFSSSAGKEDITIEQLVSHRGGFPALNETITLQMLLNKRDNEIASILEVFKENVADTH